MNGYIVGLYTLIPDKSFTTGTSGALDDLMEYYGSFPNMNLRFTNKGLEFSEKGWFNNEYIYYHFRNRKLNPFWVYSVLKSLKLSKKIHEHDWLRRRAGGNEITGEIYKYNNYDFLKKIYAHKSKYLKIKSPDFTMNSRLIIENLVSNAMLNSLEVKLSTPISSVSEMKDRVIVKNDFNMYEGKRVVICSPDMIAEKYGIKVKKGMRQWLYLTI